MVDSCHACDCCSAGAGTKTSEVTVRDVCLPRGFSERVSRGNVSAIIYGAGSFDLCRNKVQSLLSVCKDVSSLATHCLASRLQRLSVSFTNSKFYAFSEFYYTMEDILRMGGKYNSIRFQLAAQVCMFSGYDFTHIYVDVFSASCITLHIFSL